MTDELLDLGDIANRDGRTVLAFQHDVLDVLGGADEAYSAHGKLLIAIAQKQRASDDLLPSQANAHEGLAIIEKVWADSPNDPYLTFAVSAAQAVQAAAHHHGFPARKPRKADRRAPIMPRPRHAPHTMNDSTDEVHLTKLERVLALGIVGNSDSLPAATIILLAVAGRAMVATQGKPHNRASFLPREAVFVFGAGHSPPPGSGHGRWRGFRTSETASRR